MRIHLLLAATLAATATHASAADLTLSSSGYNYFHRAGATLAEHDADVRECVVQARKASQPDTQMGAGGGLIGALVLGVVKGVMDGIGERRGMAANIENCMVVRGWTVRRLPASQGATLAALTQPEQSKALASMVGAAEPADELARAFGNDAQQTTTVMFTPAGDLDKLSLSITALAPPPKDAPPPAVAPPQPRMKKSAWPAKPLKPDQLAATPVDATLVVVRLTGGQMQGGEQLLFSRTGPDATTPAWTDGQPGAFAAPLPIKMFAKSDVAYDTTLVFAVPPGQWRLIGAARGMFIASFCLGQPAFTAAKGETVFAGTFTLAGERLGPDLDLEPAKAALSALPDRVAQLKPASYVNGTLSDCGGAYIYALEAPGAPFVEGYRYGSAAKALATTANAEPAPAPEVSGVAH